VAPIIFDLDLQSKKVQGIFPLFARKEKGFLMTFSLFADDLVIC